MITLTNVECRKCGSVDVIPILYGAKQPRRDADLSLQGRIVLLAGGRYGVGAPLWACSECFAFVDQRGTCVGEDELNSSAHFRAISAAFEEYVELDDASRSFYMGRSRIRELISELTQEQESEFLVERSQDGATVRSATPGSGTLLECDERTMGDMVQFCREEMVMVVDSTRWNVSCTNTDSNEEIKLTRVT